MVLLKRDLARFVQFYRLVNTFQGSNTFIGCYTILNYIDSILFLADLESETENLREEVIRLKGMVSSLDRERDFLQQEVDQKAELLVEAEGSKARQVCQVQFNSVSFVG